MDILKNIRFILFFLVLSIATGLRSQVVYEPVESDVYQYLERLYLNGIIEYHSEIKPLTRGEIASYLLEALKNKIDLTELDQKELEFYSEEFSDELSFIRSNDGISLPRNEFFTSGQTNRFRLFNYRDSTFSFYLDPILGYDISSSSNNVLTHRMNGLELYGYFSSNWGFSLNFKDNLESGDNINRTKDYTPDRGIVLTKSDQNSIQYDDVRASINYGWQNGTISIGKDYLNLGNGLNGQLILSNKAPSFPYIKIDFYPVDWLRFVYFHGWLQSDIPDSSTYRYSQVQGRFNLADVPKFIASHFLSFYPASDLSISIGESVIYSDNIKPIYFIPVMFFRVADHYMGSGSSSSGNAQMFADISYRVIPIRTKLYSTLFIDELSIEDIFKGGNLSAIGITTGSQISDFILPNSSLIIEYTRVNPFVYKNSNDAQLYSNHNYELGHWIGSNADILYIAYKKNILRDLQIVLSAYHYRKGKTEDPQEQYQLPYPKFLYGAKRIETDLSFIIKYEPFHNIYSRFEYSFSKISDEDPIRTPVNLLGKKHSFTLSLSYGM